MNIVGYMLVPAFFGIVAFIFSYRHFVQKEESLIKAIAESFFSATGTFVFFLVVNILREAVLKR